MTRPGETVDWRSQIEAAIAGEAPDHIPAIFRLDKWYRACRKTGVLPPQIASLGLADVEDSLGLARSAREAKVFAVHYRPPVELEVRREGDRIVRTWRTPKGTLRRVLRYGPGDEEAGIAATTIEFPVRRVEDYAAYVEIVRHMEFTPTYDAYGEYDREIGRSGLPLVILGAVPFHDLLQNWTGYEQGYLDLYDRRDVFLAAVEEADRAYRRMWDIVADSPARFVLHGVNFDCRMTPPPVFREHFLPYLKAFIAKMHRHGKRVACHTDGDSRGLLELIAEAGFDVADCFACAPLVPCTAAEARSAWRDRITIWGGLPSPLLEPDTPLEHLTDHLARLYRDMAPGDRFMLAISDQAMPTSSWTHLQQACRWAHAHASYPIG
jgi:hypothetical protein